MPTGEDKQPIFTLRNLIMTNTTISLSSDLGICMDIYGEKVPYSGQSLKEPRPTFECNFTHIKNEKHLEGIKDAYRNGKKIRIEVYLD